MNAKRLIDSLFEAGHKAGCQCGFCKNKGKFGKKAEKSDDCKDGDCDDVPRKAASSTSPKSGGSKGGSSTSASMARK